MEGNDPWMGRWVGYRWMDGSRFWIERQIDRATDGLRACNRKELTKSLELLAAGPAISSALFMCGER